MALTSPCIERVEQQILHELLGHPKWHTWQHIGAYYPFQNECSPLAACHRALSLGKHIYMPHVEENTSLMSWRSYNPRSPLTPNQWDILEPIDGDAIDPGLLDVLWVPGIAFSKDFMRLGSGMGLFDRMLANYPNLHTVGIGYDFQWVDSIPTDPWDQAMDDLLIIDTTE